MNWLDGEQEEAGASVADAVDGTWTARGRSYARGQLVHTPCAAGDEHCKPIPGAAAVPSGRVATRQGAARRAGACDTEECSGGRAERGGARGTLLFLNRGCLHTWLLRFAVLFFLDLSRTQAQVCASGRAECSSVSHVFLHASVDRRATLTRRNLSTHGQEGLLTLRIALGVLPARPDCWCSCPP